MERNHPRKTVVIKKYENRRLYDTTNSRYVNLDEVAQAVQDGMDVQVVDAATGEDITRLVLTQIIVENAKAPDSNFPLDVLRQMVVATGRASQEGALKYMKAVFDLYQSAYRTLPQQLSPFDFMQSIMRPASAEAPRAAAPEAPSDAVRQAETNGASASQRPPESAHPAGAEMEVDDLRRRLEELESLVSRIGAERPAAKAKAKARRPK